ASSPPCSAASPLHKKGREGRRGRWAVSSSRSTGGRNGKVRILHRHPRGRNRAPRAPRGPAPPPGLRAGAWARRLRGQGQPHLPSLPAHQLAARGKPTSGRRELCPPLGVAAPSTRRRRPPGGKSTADWGG